MKIRLKVFLSQNTMILPGLVKNVSILRNQQVSIEELSDKAKTWQMYTANEGAMLRSELPDILHIAIK